MQGFTSIISLQEQPLSDIEIKWKQNFDSQREHITRKLHTPYYRIEQYTANQFLSEKLFIDTDEFLFISDGVICNLQALCIENNCKNCTQLIALLVEKDSCFFNKFSGRFVGIYYNKRNNTWTFFNNQTGSKKLFYFIDREFFVLSTDLHCLNQTLSKLNKKRTLNTEAAYLLLTSGFMHEGLTLINEIKQLRAGEYATLSKNKLSIQSYFNLSEIGECTDSKKTIIETLDYKFKEAVRLEFELDKSYNYKHLSTLSGGLDSRMTALIAYKLGYTDQTLLNFSEKGYADEIIAKKISESFGINIIQIGLNAESMIPIDKVVSVNSGLTIYTACSHVYSTITEIDSLPFGLLHTGMIGDAVLGSFVSQIKPTKPSIIDGAYSKQLLKKAESFLQKSVKNYATEELYKFYNRAFSGANNGFLYLDLISEATSPFLEPSFLSYAYSIPRKYKYKENLYIEWIRTLHPDIAGFTWESIGGKPTNNPYLRFIYKYHRAVVKRLPIKTMWKNNMNPEQVWYDTNMNVKTMLDRYFSDHIALFDDHKELKNDLIELYTQGNITEKAQVLTLLGAYKLLLNE